MSSDPFKLALIYDSDAYVETLRRPRRGSPHAAVGLMGRQVAGKEFLDAYLSHGTWNELVAVVPSRASAEPLVQFCQEHPSSQSRQRRLQLIEQKHFHESFFPTPPATVLHLPHPLDPRFAWARQHGGPDAFALSGVTHTLCSANAVNLLCSLVTAPFEPYDALICTSRAVTDMVRSVVGAYADYLRDRIGGSPRLRVRLETIPLGVNVERFRPARPDERAARRKALHVTDDEVAILFVGRLSHHAKAHPFPMYQGIASAAAATGRKVHLILAGWAAHPAVLRAFVEGAGTFAANVRLTVVDGSAPEHRFAVWHAADIFTSLPDNIQETFGLVIVEAMASGLPVVASDWNGYRDLVRDGQTGYLVPTTMVRDATSDLTSRLLLGEINYDHFLAQSSQSVAVDIARASDAFARLIGDAERRRRMGTAGRERAESCFAWPRVIAAYENLWSSQQSDRLAHLRQTLQRRIRGAPAAYPPLEQSFGSYATHWLADEQELEAAPVDEATIGALLSMPLTNFEADSRSTDPALIRALMAASRSRCSIASLDRVLREAGVTHQRGRATIAWMLKYGVLRRVGHEAGPEV